MHDDGEQPTSQPQYVLCPNTAASHWCLRAEDDNEELLVDLEAEEEGRTFDDEEAATEDNSKVSSSDAETRVSTLAAPPVQPSVGAL
jgi:hypothetical protein